MSGTPTAPSRNLCTLTGDDSGSVINVRSREFVHGSADLLRPAAVHAGKSTPPPTFALLSLLLVLNNK